VIPHDWLHHSESFFYPAVAQEARKSRFSSQKALGGAEVLASLGMTVLDMTILQVTIL
jgi:hypothetical protein